MAQKVLVPLLMLAIPVAMACGFGALMRRAYGVRFLSGLRWAFANRHPEIALPLLLVMLIWIGFSWGMVRLSIDGVAARIRTVVVMGRTPGDLYALDVHAPELGVSRYEGLGRLTPAGAAAPGGSLEGLFVPLVLWKSPFAAGYSPPAEMSLPAALFLSVICLGMLAVSFAVGGIAMAAARTGRMPPDGSAFPDVSRELRAAIGWGLGRVMAASALVFALMSAAVGIGRLRLDRGMPLARRQAQELRAELLRTLSPGAVVHGTVVARERFRARVTAGEAAPGAAPAIQELACYHIRLDVLSRFPVYLGSSVADAPGSERDALERALRLGEAIELSVTDDYGFRRQ